MTKLTSAQVQYMASQRLGRVATSGADRKPHVVPTSFRYNAELGAVDIGGYRVATTKKYRDVQANPWAAIVIDDLVSVDPWTPRMLEVRGRAEAVASGGADLGQGSVTPSSASIRRRSTASASSERPAPKRLANSAPTASGSAEHLVAPAAGRAATDGIADSGHFRAAPRP